MTLSLIRKIVKTRDRGRQTCALHVVQQMRLTLPSSTSEEDREDSEIETLAHLLASANLSSARASATNRMSTAGGARELRDCVMDVSGPDAFYPRFDAAADSPVWISRRTGERVSSLPRGGWECHYDERTEHEFIWNPATNERAWVPELQQADDLDAAAVALAIAAEEERGSTATDATATAIGADMIAEEELVARHCHLAPASKWVEFEEKGTGKLYYFHPDRGVVQWAMPAEGVARTADGREAIPRALRLTVSAIQPGSRGRSASSPAAAAAAVTAAEWRRSRFTINALSTDKLADVKRAICAQGPSWTPAEEDQLVALRGQLFEDAAITLGQMQVQDGAVVHLINWGETMMRDLDDLCRRALLEKAT